MEKYFEEIVKRHAERLGITELEVIDIIRELLEKRKSNKPVIAPNQTNLIDAINEIEAESKTSL